MKISLATYKEAAVPVKSASAAVTGCFSVPAKKSAKINVEEASSMCPAIGKKATLLVIHFHFSFLNTKNRIELVNMSKPIIAKLPCQFVSLRLLETSMKLIKTKIEPREAVVFQYSIFLCFSMK